MSIHVALHHRTSYQYERPVEHGAHVVRLRPAPHCRSNMLAYSLKVGPMEHFINWQQDPQANYLARVVFPEPMALLDIEVDLIVEMSVQNPFDFFLEPDAEKFPFAYEPDLARDLAPFLAVEKPGPLLKALIDRFKDKTGRTIDVLVEMNSCLQHAIDYKIRMEPGVQAPEETLELASGSCRDSAWLLVNLLRHLGLASRFVSGYLIQLKPDVKSLDGPVGAEVDFTDLHAWTEVYLPGAGWIGFDATSGLLAGEGHIPLACSPDPSSAAPVTGGVEPCESEMEHVMTVTRVYESPRTTLPYTEEQWQEILKTGHKIDDDLNAMDVRLTMGGEPTFISMDDFDGDEWNTAAVGPTKRLLSGQLHQAPAGEIRSRRAAVLRPGKMVSRRDPAALVAGVLLAQGRRADLGGRFPDRRRIPRLQTRRHPREALRHRPGRRARGRSQVADPGLRGRLLLHVAGTPPADQCGSAQVQPEGQDRARPLRPLFNQGLDEVVGYAMPLERRMTRQGLRWTSGPWFLRDETLFLLPGDSPMGYRLPLDSLPWVKESEYPWHIPQDPTRALPEFPKVTGRTLAHQRRELDKVTSHARPRGRKIRSRKSPGRKSPPSSNPPHGSPAARSASSRATAACTFSCRR